MKTVRLHFVFPVLAGVMLLAGGCASGSKPVAEQTADAPPVLVVVPATKSEWVKTELYFALGEWEATALSTEAEVRWTAFLDKEITPRFPDGLTVVEIYGQSRGSGSGAEANPGGAAAQTKVKRERSRLVVVLHRETPEVSAKIEEIRAAWKLATGEASVLRVTQPADVSF